MKKKGERFPSPRSNPTPRLSRVSDRTRYIYRFRKDSMQNQQVSKTLNLLDNRRNMTEVRTSALKEAVESQHGGTATFVQSVPIREEHEGSVVWDGTVAVFDLTGHPTAKRAYAWSYELPDGKRRFFAVLHMPPIIGPREAVRAAIVAEQRAK